MYFEDFQIGNRFESHTPRTVTKEDIEKFANLTGDMNLLHLDDEFARTRKFKGRIAHGVLSLGFAIGQWYSLNLTRDSVIALVGINNLSFRAPIYPGEQIRLISGVVSKKDSKSEPNAGIVTFRDRMVKQDDTTVLEFERLVMLKKKVSNYALADIDQYLLRMANIRDKEIRRVSIKSQRRKRSSNGEASFLDLKDRSVKKSKSRVPVFDEDSAKSDSDQQRGDSRLGKLQRRL